MNDMFTGVGVALVTPFKADGSVDHPGLEKLVAHVCDGGVDYIVANSTTGEASTIPHDEKRAILATIKSVAGGRKPIVYGIGNNDTQAALNTLQDFDFDGISGILTVSPYYNKPTQEGIYQHYKLLAAASPVPLILYNVPGRTAANIAADTTLRLAQLPNIAATKEASGDLDQCREIAQKKPKDFLLLSGDDLQAVDMIEFGGKGVISVLANAFPKIFTEMVHMALNGDIATARKLQADYFEEINDYLYEESNPVGIKKVLELMGICAAHVRMPLLPATPALSEKIRASLDRIAALKETS